MIPTRDLHHHVVRRERRDPYHVMSDGREKVRCRPDRSASVATGRRVRGHDSRDGRYYFFAAAARSTKVLPPFILCANGASLIWMTTASASTPRFFTSACVISRIMPAFCSSVRPAAMLTVISGISSSPFALAHCHKHDPHPNTHTRAAPFAPMSPSAKADDPVSRAGLCQLWRPGVLDARFRGHDSSVISTSPRAYRESCGLHR